LNAGTSFVTISYTARILTAPHLEHVFSGNVQIHGAVADEIAELAQSAVAAPVEAGEEEAEGKEEQGVGRQ
jgi:phage tail sheath protein FI